MSSQTASKMARKLAQHLVLASLMLLMACSGRTVDSSTRTELPGSIARNVDAPVDELYNESRELYERGLYLVAINTLQSLVNNYPTSEYTEFARLKLIDCYFQVRNYSESTKFAQAFVNDYPNSKDLPYALYVLAESHRQIYGGTGRDVEPLQLAAKSYQQIVDEHGGSRYYQSAKIALLEINQEVSNYQKSVISFYEKRELNEAAGERRGDLDRYLETHDTAVPNLQQGEVSEGVSIDEARQIDISKRKAK